MKTIGIRLHLLSGQLGVIILLSSNLLKHVAASQLMTYKIQGVGKVSGSKRVINTSFNMINMGY
jgi:hypothetical protein